MDGFNVMWYIEKIIRLYVILLRTFLKFVKSMEIEIKTILTYYEALINP